MLFTLLVLELNHTVTDRYDSGLLHTLDCMRRLEDE